MREYGTEDFDAKLNIAYSDDLELSKDVGCKVCNNSGYRGRMALHELLMGTDENSQKGTKTQRKNIFSFFWLASAMNV